MATRSGKRKGEAGGGIIFSTAEENAVKVINKAGKTNDAANRVIGKVVAELVEERGGTAYGDQTLKRLVQHPALQCSEEQLRRCWQYHRFLGLYAKKLGKQARKLTYSHHYQLSRLLDIENEMAQQEAVAAMAAQAVNEKFTVTDLQKAVSKRLVEHGRKIKSNPKSPQSEPDAFEMLIDTSKNAVKAAAMIVKATDVARIVEFRDTITSLGFTYVQLVAKLIAVGDIDAIDAAKNVIAAVEVAIGTNVTKGGNPNVNG